jgi:predicted DNA-binding protein with PD1-like motif
MRITAIAAILMAGPTGNAMAQDVPFDYMPSSAVKPGTAPGLNATELSPHSRVFQITFAKGDDVAAGLADFANKNHLTNAQFSGIGAFGSATIGWSDRPKKAFKVVKLNEEMEVASFDGSITRDKDGKPFVHAHCVVALLSNGHVYAGHCLEERVSLTMQMYLTDYEPTP